MDSNQQPSPLTNSPEVDVADFHGSAKSEMQIGGCQDASDLVQQLGGGNSNIFHVHPYLGKISYLTNIFQMG